ncbi:putative mfs multidrug [Phaeomoniella chlamydospora]|uniref:Putative mfs multidrug n=1 Tax=Phaeomoniella chlamydospora TaxID=158046 RepID=A0A0G2EEL7_PHACM|nr:putative mfs multidrug [Phaeomoniella chlamydospora]
MNSPPTFNTTTASNSVNGSNDEQSQGAKFESAATTPRISFERQGGTLENIESINQEPERNVTDDDSSVGDDSRFEEKDADIEKNGEAPANTSPENHVDDPNLVVWDGPDDPENPMNWPITKKWTVTILLATMTLTITFASSIFSTATIRVSEEYHISNEVSILGTSLFVLGFCFGPLVWGPFSEIYGRMPPLFAGFAIFAIFQIPVAVAQNVETIMLSRFLGGFFGCSPLAIVGGALADFWDPVDRGVAIAIFAAATFIGPVAGPIVGGFVTQSHLGWRWTAWITLIMAAAFGTISLIVIPETSGPKLLQRRAAQLRQETKNWALHAKADEQRLNPSDLVTRYLTRPFIMLFKEPILMLITIYLAFIYGILYLFFEAYPITFQEQRGWNEGVGQLPFIGITIGVVIGATIVSFVTKTRFARKLRKHGRVIPEERLPPMILGAVILPAGLFWFAWTSSPHITWVPQVIAGIPIGCGVFMIFMQGLNYIIDCYLWHANSAIAGNTLIRSLAGAGFPLFANQMYAKLGVDWATSLLAFLCVAMIPVPILFYIYGKRIRSLSKFSPT